jgi:hypothetical protein
VLVKNVVGEVVFAYRAQSISFRSVLDRSELTVIVVYIMVLV